MLLPTSFDQQYQYVEDCNFEADENGDLQVADDGDIKKRASFIRKMVAISKPHYKEVSISHKDGEKYSSFDELSYNRDFDSMLVEVAGLVINGRKRSKK